MTGFSNIKSNSSACSYGSPLSPEKSATFSLENEVFTFFELSSRFFLSAFDSFDMVSFAFSL
jgi:hypothetical protein